MNLGQYPLVCVKTLTNLSSQIYKKEEIKLL